MENQKTIEDKMIEDFNTIGRAFKNGFRFSVQKAFKIVVNEAQAFNDELEKKKREEEEAEEKKKKADAEAKRKAKEEEEGKKK